jgi:ABC-type uncharacterized transport system ATPase subunit
MTEAFRPQAQPPAPVGAPPLALGLRGVSKRFGTVQANDEISFDVAGGSVHALVGENGAGKTTLMRIVYGLYPPDEGHVELDGQPVVFRSPRHALGRGVGMVHQHSLQLASLSVAENVMLALPGLGPPRYGQVLAELRELAARNHLNLDPGARVSTLSVGARQRAEILAAVFHGARLLILDEPTTVLTPQEVTQLFAVLRRLHGQGTTIVIVTHKLVEVMEISDAVTVLRNGRHVATLAAAETDEQALVRLMVGRDVPRRARDAAEPATAEAHDEPLLGCAGLRVVDDLGVERVSDVDLAVRAGEIVAVTGVEGNGQRELTGALVGLLPAAAGRITLRGQDVTGWPVGRRRRAGLAYVPESRMTEGISALDSVGDNLVLGRHGQAPFARFGFRDLNATTRLARELVERFAIIASSPESPAATLSGGNLQKVVVARELAKEPLLLVAAQPTQGVDVAAAHLIRQKLCELRDRGAAILLVSSDLNEVCDVADRAVVLYRGAVIGELPRRRLSEEAIGFLAMGYRSASS